MQYEACAAFAKSRGYQILDERFDDEGHSGASLDRPALQRLLTLIRSRRIAAVVVHRLDRLSRRVLDCATLTKDFQESGVRLLVTAMPELSRGAAGSLVLNLLSSFAEFEREMILSRIEDTRARLIAHRRRIAGRTPFGYVPDPRTKQLVPDGEEAEIVRELFRHVADGIRPSELERIAGERGWITRSGRPWTARQILETVSNTVYVGRFRAKNGSRPGNHEALVDDTTFQRCADRVRSRRTAEPGEPRTRQLWSVLQGKVRCARCGQFMKVHVNRYRNRQYVSFRCRRAPAGERPCTGTQIRAYDVVRGVGESLRKFPWRRGRPPKWLKATRALGAFFSMLTSKDQKTFFDLAVREVVWNAEARSIRVSFDKDGLAKYLADSRQPPDDSDEPVRKPIRRTEADLSRKRRRSA